MSKKCFVVCPISDENTEIRKRSDQLLKHIIKPACQECGFDEPERVDLMANPNSITDKILECLRTYDLVIVDLTGHNPNVFYELGYRVALSKPLIQLKSKTDTIPFDVANINTIDYDLQDLDEADKTRTRLSAMINTFEFDSADSEDTQLPNTNTLSSTILQELYAIKDDVSVIREQTKSLDISAISVLADKLTATNQKTDNQVLMEAILPKILENPESLVNLFKLSEKFQNGNKF
ncbi:hypothetical protein [Candidatus Stoquefichus massiliensis]|uniref:hypothetical protein n=1 Tax=Candidatus Stoquefichus massiliensis TaxID=1470350 RepID=UPI0004895F1D|nr:hypothetical protein [Candidatus Stoquefichus massiliensis]